MFHLCKLYLKALFSPGILSQTIENVEIVRPRLSEASKARWRERFSTLPPRCVRPQLKYAVSFTSSGRIITILGDDKDSDDEDSIVPPMSVRPKLRYSVSYTPTGKIITILGNDNESDSDNEQFQ